MLEMKAMNGTSRSVFAILVFSLLLFQPFGKCVAAPAAAVCHECCPAPAKAECELARCVCETAPVTPAAIPQNADSGPLMAVVPCANPHAEITAFRLTDLELLRILVSDRFIALHQFLI
jgi:hypothetical protein